MKKVLIAISSIFFLVAGFWLIVIPERFIVDRIENSLKGDVALETQGFKKGLFYNFGIEKIVAVKRGNLGKSEPSPSRESPAAGIPLVIFDDFRGRMNLMSLLKLSPSFGFECNAHGGRIEGAMTLTDLGALTMSAKDIGLKGLPLLNLIGIHGDGDLSGTLTFAGERGEMRFSVDGAKLRSTTLGGVYLPLDFFHAIKGSATINGKNVEIQSFVLQGKGVYARVKGIATRGNLNMNMEIMTDSSFTAGPVLQTMLERYEVSPGYYVIPLKAPL